MSFARKVLASSNLFLIALSALAAAPIANGEGIAYQSYATVYSNAPYVSSEPTTIDPYVSFKGIASGTTDLSGPITLGEFVVNPPAAGTSKSYQNAEFLMGVTFSNPALGPYTLETLTIQGRLNGVLTGGVVSTLQATITNIGLVGYQDFGDPPPPLSAGNFFPYGDFHIEGPMDLTVNQAGGSFTVVAEVKAVPEPATIATFLLAIGAGAVARRVSRPSASRSS